MRIFGLDIRRATRTIAPTMTPAPSRSSAAGRAWFPIVREPYTGAWQENVEISADSALAYFAVFACVTLIAQDIGKLRLRLVEIDDDGIWNEITSAAFSPVLRKPNRYQTAQKFIEQWITSKLIAGNTYALKQRDARGVVVALYVLDPSRVVPLVATDGSVYYQLNRDDLAGIPELATGVVVPASEVIHDRMVCLFHPLVGVSPIFACGLSALQGLNIQSNASKFFANGSNPGGVLTAPGAIADETAQRLKAYWDANFTGDNAGKVAVLGDGLKYEAMALTAVESQLIEQLKFSAETVCACFHVPAYMVLTITGQAPFANNEPMLQAYYAQCLQSLITAFETTLDDGLELPTGYGTEFDIDDLIWMDTATKSKAAQESIGAGALSPDEARKKYFGLGPVPGGDSPYLQQQYYSLAALAERDASQPFTKPTPPTPPPTNEPPPNEPDAAALAKAFELKNFAGMYAT